jgi:hypothetical protein
VRTRYRGVAIGAGAAAGFAGMQWLGRTAGATRAERESHLPGDGLIEHPMMVTTHAITIEAPPQRIWPWLVQMGWHRGQWYTARWVDRILFPQNEPSADRIVPELQHLAVGDWVPDGPPETGCGFVVDVLEPGQLLVLHPSEHLPPQFADRFSAWMDWTWAFALSDLGQVRTRFVFRSRACLGPWWLAAGYWALIIPADFVMARQMLHGVKARAEGVTAPADFARPAAAAGSYRGIFIDGA